MSIKITKHAYLIIAHNEFEVLAKLLQAIDDERNDVFLHFDKKVRLLPHLEMKHSTLYILSNRVDVRWGNVSQIKCEYALFDEAYKCGPYQYYHLISGVHLPLCTQDKIHDFFNNINGSEVLQPVPNSDFQTDLKMRRYNFFTRQFSHSRFFQMLWNLCFLFQRKLNIRRHTDKKYWISSNWVSITNGCVKYILEKEQLVLKDYCYTLCGDEFFLRTLLEMSDFKSHIYIYDKLLKCDFAKGPNPRIYTIKDYDELMKSHCLFARKFSHTDMEIVTKIVNAVSK